MSIESEYDRVFYEAGIANRELRVIDEALYSLKLQRKALQAAVHVRNHALADYIVAHGEEIRAITKRRGDERSAELAADESAAPSVEGVEP